MTKYNIGIIGLGYVGSAVKSYVEKFYPLNTYDIAKKCSSSSLQELVNKSEIIFVCLPTPMYRDGSCDFSVIDEVLGDINDISNDLQNRIIVLKSTVPVGTSKVLNEKFNHINIVFNPEFLTEANFIKDFENQDRIIIGGLDNKSIEKVSNFYSDIFNDIQIIKTDFNTAEMVKYTTNCFLATKVSFANEIKMFCDKLDINYKDMINISTLDKRLANSHWSVPGPDGKKGFGGACFPKDIASLIYQFRENDVESYVLSSTWERNKKIDRPEKDWELLKGRAIRDD